MKSYTDLEQSKKLVEFLPVESADMCYRAHREECGILDFLITLCPHQFAGEYSVPCWSLTALLNIISNRIYSIDEDANLILSSYKNIKWDLSINNLDIEVTKLDPIDACMEMIYKLKEMNLL